MISIMRNRFIINNLKANGIRRISNDNIFSKEKIENTYAKLNEVDSLFKECIKHDYKYDTQNLFKIYKLTLSLKRNIFILSKRNGYCDVYQDHLLNKFYTIVRILIIFLIFNKLCFKIIDGFGELLDKDYNKKKIKYFEDREHKKIMKQLKNI